MTLDMKIHSSVTRGNDGLNRFLIMLSSHGFMRHIIYVEIEQSRDSQSVTHCWHYTSLKFKRMKS